MTNVLITGDLRVEGASEVPSQLKCAILKDEKSSSSNGGASIAGDQDRTLNTLKDPYNLITLDAGNVLFSFNETGTYIIKASAPAYISGRHKCFLTDSTNTVVLTGSSQYQSIHMDARYNLMTLSTLSGILTVSSTATQYKLRHYIETARIAYGLGYRTNSGQNNVYSQLIVIKISN